MSLIRKALSVGTGGNITDYLPAPMAKKIVDYIREISLMRRLLKSFIQRSRTWKKATRATGGSAYHVGDGTEVTQTNFTSGSVTWTAKKLMVYFTVDEEAFEDSLPDLMSQVLDDGADALAEAEENAILNGDDGHTATAATVAAATETNWFTQDARLMFDGIFPVATSASASDNVDAASGTFDKEMVNTALYNLGKYGRNKSKLIGLLPSSQASNIRSNSDWHSAATTGLALAAFISGMGSAGEADGLVTTIYGIRFFETPQVSSANEDKIAILDKSSPEVGDRRKIKLATDNVVESDQRKFVMSERISFNYNNKAQLTAIDNLSTTIAS